MLSTRASGWKKNTWLPRLYENKERALSARATDSKKRLVATGAICESNGLFFWVETTRKDTELLKCE